MRTLVTGGAGFIGSGLVDRLLADGHAVDVVDNLVTGSIANLEEARARHGDRMAFFPIDIRDPELPQLFCERRPQVVFHLAAQADVRVSVARPVFDTAVNVLGSVNVLEASRSAGVAKVVFASSGGTIYGIPDPADLPINEAHPQHPVSPYGVAKKSVFDYLRAYRQLHGLNFTALALANVYGPRQDPHGEAGVVAIFAGQLLQGRRCTIYGDGTQTRDFVYVHDVVDAFARAAHKGDGMLLNICTGIETNINTLHRILAHAAATPDDAATPRYQPSRAGELARSSLDPTQAGHHLHWTPRTTIVDGAKAVIESLRDPTTNGRPTKTPADRHAPTPPQHTRRLT